LGLRDIVREGKHVADLYVALELNRLSMNDDVRRNLLWRRWNQQRAAAISF
jgi:hypothetical protein